MRTLPLALLLACAKATPPPPVAPPPAPATVDADPIVAAVAHPERPAEDRARDEDRKPAQVLAYFGVQPGMVVADLMAGRGWYTEILARVVGPEGRVYAQNNAYVVERFADAPLSERLGRLGMDHVVRVDRELDDLGIPPASLDAALMVLFYHDTYWMELDRQAINRAVYTSLKPGGIYGVVDHHAEAGTGDRDVKTLHRVDEALVIQEILAAGFVLDGQSDLLRHDEDDRTRNVFDEGLRGRTDRFVLRFRRPLGSP